MQKIPHPSEKNPRPFLLIRACRLITQSACRPLLFRSYSLNVCNLKLSSTRTVAVLLLLCGIDRCEGGGDERALAGVIIRVILMQFAFHTDVRCF